MNRIVLNSKRNADNILAEILLQGGQPDQLNPTLRLEVREDKCLKNWLGIGEIALFPEPISNFEKEADAARDKIRQAVRLGFFTWLIPPQDELICGMASDLHAGQDTKKIAEATKAILHVAVRCGLSHPVFDAHVLERMQSKRPFSVVIDTSAVLQGGLDFLARHATPSARIKVPALVHMEILNFVDRYFTQRRKARKSPQMLLDHVNGLGGQRVLLRLEIDQGIEFERPRLGADPLRGIIAPDSDVEDKNLGLQKIQRSFADRLILETAVQHRDKGGPDHPVMLLTSDQGLARMALAESIQPIFFDSNAVSSLFGKKLSGVNFIPFASQGSKLKGTGLIELLWEFATTFGSSRLVYPYQDECFTLEAVALDEKVNWQPYHSYEDLLWTRQGRHPASNGEKTETQSLESGQGGKNKGERRHAETVRNSQSKRKSSIRQSGIYTFSLNSMMQLLGLLHEYGEISDDAGMSELEVKTVKAYRGYYGFLVAGELAIHQNGVLRKTNLLDKFIETLLKVDYSEISEFLCRVDSFHAFKDRLEMGKALKRQDSGLGHDSFRTYSYLAEICCLGIRFVEDGVFGTPANPQPMKFVTLAFESYRNARAGERFALTGAWLEELSRKHGIHPIRVRQRMAESYQAGYIRRYFEGSTPETRFENRTVQILAIDQGKPIIRTVNLYHGDFLLPGRASVSIRLSQGENHESS